MLTRVNLIGYTSTEQQPDLFSKFAQTPVYKRLAKQKFCFTWHAIIKATGKSHELNLAEANRRLARYTQKLVCDQLRFLVLSDDENCTFASWGGAQTAIKHHGKFGLIWLCAEPSSAVNALITSAEATPIVQPKNLCLVGLHQLSKEQEARLLQHQVRIFYLEEVKQRGLAEVLAEARHFANQETVGYGLSLNFNAIDLTTLSSPAQTAVNGLCAKELSASLAIFSQDKHLLGITLTDFDLKHASCQTSTKLCCNLIEILFSQ